MKSGVKIPVSLYKWLERNPDYTYSKWKSLRPSKLDTEVNLPTEKKEVGQCREFETSLMFYYLLFTIFVVLNMKLYANLF